jgi:putative endonuclease
MLTRNFQCRYGEVDLIMREQDCTVFVEVRYRNTAARGGGLASVGQSKRQKLLRTAAVYLQANPRLATQPCRFDVIACQGTPTQPQFAWLRAAFEGEP